MDDKKRREREGVTFTRNRRRTLAKQLAKVEARVVVVKAAAGGEGAAAAATAGEAVPPRCRSCFKEGCDGLCWGFWKGQSSGGGCTSRSEALPAPADAAANAPHPPPS